MSSSIYTAYKTAAVKGSIAPLTDTIKAALIKNTYTPALDTHTYFSDISANELAAGSGYTAGGQALATKAVNQDNANHLAAFTSANPTWTGITFSGVRWLAIYKDTGNAATSPLIALLDLVNDQASAGGNFTVQLPTQGVFYLS